MKGFIKKIVSFIKRPNRDEIPLIEDHMKKKVGEEIPLDPPIKPKKEVK